MTTTMAQPKRPPRAGSKDQREVTERASRSGPLKTPRGLPIRELLGYGVIAASVWLAWEAIKVPFVERAPPAMALRLAPSSPEVLRRAAEVELAADRTTNAAALADQSLAGGAFNARALRIRGLAASRLGQSARADELLTLAGNWSLRDDPAHVWLVDRRLRQGNYGSAFAHADTLARRRIDLHPSIFNLFTTAATQDPRSLPHLARLLAAEPPWRRAYWNYLHSRPDGDGVFLWLAMALERTREPLDNDELKRLYAFWVFEKRFQAISLLREASGRPSSSSLVQNGDFSDPLEDQLLPFGWRLGAGSGLSVQVAEDDLRATNPSLWVNYDGYGNHLIAEQLLVLAPGQYRLNGEQRLQARSDTAGMAWIIECVGSDRRLAEYRPTDRTNASDRWTPFSVSVQVPAENCPAQSLQLLPRPGDRHSNVVAWFDNMTISRSSGAPAPKPGR